MPTNEPRLSEQRRHPRANMDLAVGYQANGSYNDGRLRNVGRGGVSLASDKRHVAGTVISLQFATPSGWVIAAEGCVVFVSWDTPSQEFHHGIAFHAINEADQRAIDEFVIARS